jgi:hypothetical protein
MRPVDWSPLADHDPIPGDPSAVAAMAQHLATVAARIRAQVETLERLDAGDIWDSEAAQVFTAAQREVPGDLEALATRYERVSDVLDEFQAELAGAQHELDAALARARVAQADLEAADAGIARMEEWEEQACVEAEAGHADPAGLPVEPEPWWGEDHRAARADAEARLDSARADAAAAVERRDQAAGRATWAVDLVIGDALENDSGLISFVKGASDVLGYAGAVVGLASIAVPVLAPVSYGLGVASLAVDAGLAASGEGDWGDVAEDAAGVATGGMGRALDLAGDAGEVAGSSARLRQGFGLGSIGDDLQRGLDDIAATGLRSHISAEVDDVLTLGSRHGAVGVVVTSADLSLTAHQADEAARATPGYVRRAGELAGAADERVWRPLGRRGATSTANRTV